MVHFLYCIADVILVELLGITCISFWMCYNNYCILYTKNHLLCVVWIHNEIEWATGLRYLGVLFTSAKMLTVDMSMQTRKFYAASNSILHNSIYVSEMSRLHLIEA